MGAHGRHALACLVTLPLLSAGVTIGGERAALTSDDRVALATGDADDTPFLDRHPLPFLVTLVLGRTSVTYQGIAPLMGP